MYVKIYERARPLTHYDGTVRWRWAGKDVSDGLDRELLGLDWTEWLRARGSLDASLILLTCFESMTMSNSILHAATRESLPTNARDWVPNQTTAGGPSHSLSAPQPYASALGSGSNGHSTRLQTPQSYQTPCESATLSMQPMRRRCHHCAFMTR